jgi:predicted RNA binding protein YcfA (HicA-like mRNA interferase family)
MALPKHVWDQLKATTIEEFISALKRDGFESDPASSGGGTQAYIKCAKSGNIRVVLHYHPGKSWGPKFLKGLIESAGWTTSDLGRVGLIAKSQEGSIVATTLVPCECNQGIVGDDKPCPVCGGTCFREVPIQ